MRNPLFLAPKFYDLALQEEVRVHILSLTQQLRNAQQPTTPKGILGRLSRMGQSQPVSQTQDFFQECGFSRLRFALVRADRSSVLVKATYTGSRSQVKSYHAIVQRGVGDICQVIRGDVTLSRRQDSTLSAVLRLPVVNI